MRIMRSLAAVALVAAAFIVGACTTNSTPGTSSSDAVQTTNDVIANVQTITSAACSFLPTIATIASIFAADKVATPAAVAQAICNAITSKSASSGSVVKVKGVTIRGRFVGPGS